MKTGNLPLNENEAKILYGLLNMALKANGFEAKEAIYFSEKIKKIEFKEGENEKR